MIDIETLKKMNQPEKIALTKHAKERLTERNITVADIVSGIETGEIIKQYWDGFCQAEEMTNLCRVA